MVEVSNTDSDDTPSYDAGKKINQEIYRFSRDAVDEFDSSQESRVLMHCFWFFALFYMWPYQTLAQTQNFLVAAFPEEADTAGFIMMMSCTWPMFLTHSLFTLSGLTRRLSYAIKVMAPTTFVCGLAVYLIFVLEVSDEPSVLLYSLYSVALLESLAESFVEPAVYDLAGLFPSTLTSQAVQSGNGACGLIVSCVQISARLLTNGLGPIKKEQLRSLTEVFLAIMGVTSLAIIYIYMRVRKSNFFREYVQMSHKPAHSLGNAVAQEKGKNTQSIWSATVEAARYVWPSFIAITLTFGVSLVLWPVIPGRTCTTPPEMAPADGPSTLQTWWFDLVILSFNLSDFLGRSMQKSLQWGARVLTPMNQLWLAVVRAVIFLPLILTGSAPQMYSPLVARWVVLIATFLLGLSNGWLSTVSFMRAPKALPPDSSNAVAEQASALCVVGLFLGVSGGCVAAYLLGTTLLSGSLGKCYGAA